jgi:hypothetical protein
MSSIIKASFWLILICGISAFLGGVFILAGLMKTTVSFGGTIANPTVAGIGQLFFGVLLVISAIFLTKEKSRKAGAIMALIISFLITAFDLTGRDNSDAVLLVASILALTHKNP